MQRGHLDRLFRQQPGLRKRTGDVGQNRDVLGQHAVIGAQRRNFAARIDIEVPGSLVLVFRDRNQLQRIGRAGFFERDVRRQ